jgi:hypothetical protein
VYVNPQAHRGNLGTHTENTMLTISSIDVVRTAVDVVAYTNLHLYIRTSDLSCWLPKQVFNLSGFGGYTVTVYIALPLPLKIRQSCYINAVQER